MESPVKRNAVNKTTMRLAIAWMRDEITTSEAARKLECQQVSQVVYKLGIALREASREGMIGKRLMGGSRRKPLLYETAKAEFRVAPAVQVESAQVS